MKILKKRIINGLITVFVSIISIVITISSFLILSHLVGPLVADIILIILVTFIVGFCSLE